MVSLLVRNKTHLKNRILKIFDKYPMLTNKKYDYIRFREGLMSNIKYYENLPKYVRPSSDFLDVNSIITTNYFPAWLIGFIEAEGYFGIIKQNKNYDVAFFEISQTNGEIILSAIRSYLSFTSNIYTDKTYNSRLKVSSLRSIENILNFLDKAPVKLLGYKKLQYVLFLNQLRKIDRYSSKIKIPLNY